MKLSTIVKSFRDLNILVIGDLMIDTYLWGSSNRISPEAPVPVVDIEGTENRLGGSGNVALNLAQLGVKTFLCSVCGDDSMNSLVKDLLRKNLISPQYIITDQSRVTTQKTRVISQGRHIIRFDSESRVEIDDNVKQSILSNLKEIVSKENIHAIILQDYNKGLLTSDLIESIISIAKSHEILIAVDPKRTHFFGYQGIDLFKPNLHEVSEALLNEVDPNKEESLEKACKELCDKLSCSNILLTLSDKGMFFYEADGNYDLVKAHLRNIVDVSGAGDTVISVATASLVVDPDIAKAAILSNLAGGLVCEKVGVVPISNSELLDALRHANEEEVRMVY